MAIAAISTAEHAAPGVAVRPLGRHRRRRVTSSLVAGGVAVGLVLLVGLGGDGTAEAGRGSGTIRGWEASSRRWTAEAEAHLAQQADIARGRAADSARLQAAADVARERDE